MTRKEKTMRRFASFVLVTCAVPLAALVRAQQTPVRDNAVASSAGAALISGTIVTDDPSSQPVRNATVKLGTVDLPNSRTAVTDDQGRFALTGVPAGRYTLSVSKPGMIDTAYGAKRPQGPGSAIPVVDGQRVTGIVMKMLRGAVITGTVRDENGQPLTLASVSVMQYRPNYQTGERTLASVSRGLGSRTDDRGMYRTYDLPPGDYLVVVTLGSPIASSNADMHQVTATEMVWANRQLQSSGPLDTASAAAPASGPNVIYAPVFFPGTPVEASAATITLAAGEERTGVDIPLVLVPTARLTGTIVSADGALPPNLRANLVAQDRVEGLPFAGFMNAPAIKDGKFTMTGLAPGQYTVVVRAAAGPAPGPDGVSAGAASDPASTALFAIDDVTISGEDTTVSLMLRSGVTVSGKLVFEGASLAPPVDLTKARVAMNPVVTGRSAALGVPAATVNANGEFEFIGVTPGRYRLSATVPGSTPTSGWQPKSAIVDGRDTLDVPIDIRGDNVSGVVVTFTDRPTEISGSIQDGAGHPAPEYWVILFPADKTFWTPQSRRVQAKRPGSDGKFSFPNMPPGDYLIGAVTDIEPYQWFDPAFLAQLASAAVKIPLREGEKKVQNISIGGGGPM